MQVFKVFVRMVFAVEASELSALFFFWYIKAGGGFMFLAEVAGGAQQDLIEGGSDSIVRGILTALNDRVKIVLDTPVKELTNHSDHVVIGCGETTYNAKYVINTIPPKVI